MALPDGDELADLHYFDIDSGAGGLYGPGVTDRGNLHFFEVEYGAAFPQGGASSGGVTPPPLGYSRFWRLSINEGRGGAGAQVGLSELEMRESIGGSDSTAPGGSASASSEYTALGSVVANAVDNSNSTYWLTESAPTIPITFEYDFPSAVQIVEVALRSIGSGIYNGDSTAIKSFDLQYFNITTGSWITVLSVTGEPAWSAGETRVYSYAPTSSERRALLFVIA